MQAINTVLKSGPWAHAAFWGLLGYAGFLLTQHDYQGALAIVVAAFHGAASVPILGQETK